MSEMPGAVWVLVSVLPGDPVVSVHRTRDGAEQMAETIEREACEVKDWQGGWRPHWDHDDRWVRTAEDGCLYILYEENVDA